MNSTFLAFDDQQKYMKLSSTGEWTIQNVQQIEAALKKISTRKDIVWDLSGVSRFDSAGTLLFIEFYNKFSQSNHLEVIGYSKKQKEMFDLLNSQSISEPLKETQNGLLESVGKASMTIYQDVVSFVTFLGRVTHSFFNSLLNPKSIRIKEMIYHIHHSGFNALIIIGLTSFLVGMVIAYQGAAQLVKFGADIFIVDTVGISIVRELGPMITAIVIAGRSGSAYTAEIGAMKITEEISAMRTMGFDPYAFLVLPRIFALMIALPLLIFFADVVGIFGGMVASGMQLNISMWQFTDRLYEVLELKHYVLGMIKGPVFAFIIASVGCYRGFQVADNTESIGLQTTASVVNSIFLVIAFDALFSVLYTELGL